MAAGFSLRAERVEDFRAFLNERLAAASALPSAADLASKPPSSVPGATTDLARRCSAWRHSGPGNEEPMLVLHRARVVRADRVGQAALDPRCSSRARAAGRG